MESLLTHLWKPAMIIMIFYGFYRFFLQRETYFQSIRFFLLSGIVLAFMLPFIIIPIYVDIEPAQIAQIITNDISTGTNFFSDSSLNWVTILFYGYVVVTTIFVIRFILQLASVGIIIFKNKRIKVDNYYIVETDSDTSPFSFFNFMIYNPDHFTKKELDQILAHEKAHVNQKHSIDTLLSNLLIALQWFNPFAWLYKKDIEQNLEFIADELAQKTSSSQQSYQQLLLKTSIPNYQMALANNFYNSLLKKRIIMLHKVRSNNKSKWKIALITPFLIAFVFTFNTKTIAQQKKIKKEVVKINVEVFALLITKESDEKDLEEITKTFAKKGLKVKFAGIKRNNNDEITAIKIDAKTNNGKASASYAANNDEGIPPIHISFDKEHNGLSIGSNDNGHGHNYSFSDKRHRKIIKHSAKGKGAKHVFISHDDNDEGHEIHEIHIDMDEDGKEVKKEVIKIKKGDSKGNFVFISDDDDDKNIITTYIVNGKKMSKAAFEKFDKDKIKTIEIKKEVKKEN